MLKGDTVLQPLVENLLNVTSSSELQNAFSENAGVFFPPWIHQSTEQYLKT